MPGENITGENSSPDCLQGVTVRGFTLLEMLVVLVMLSVMAGITAPAIGKFLDNLAFRQELDRITGHLRKCRLKAVTEGEEVVVWQEGWEFFAAPRKGDDSELWYEGSDRKFLTMEPARIVFTPYSTATPARILIKYDNRKEIIQIDSLSGLPVIR